jgi:hypothetical protein
VHSSHLELVDLIVDHVVHLGVEASGEALLGGELVESWTKILAGILLTRSGLVGCGRRILMGLICIPESARVSSVLSLLPLLFDVRN